MKIGVYPRGRKLWIQKLIIDGFNKYINENNLQKKYTIIKKKYSEVDTTLDIVITQGIDYTIIDKYRKLNINCICIDSSSVKNIGSFIILNGLRPPIGKYLGFLPKPTNNFENKLEKIQIKELRKTGSHILVCLNNIKNTKNQTSWKVLGCNNNNDKFNLINKTITQIQKYTNRKIVIRFHPKTKKKKKLIEFCRRNKIKNIIFSKNKNINDDVNNCWFGVCFSSSSVCFELFKNGIPFHCFKQNIGYPISIPLNKIEELNMTNYDRDLFLKKCLNSIWNTTKSDFFEYLDNYIFPNLKFKKLYVVKTRISKKSRKTSKNKNKTKKQIERKQKRKRLNKK